MKDERDRNLPVGQTKFDPSKQKPPVMPRRVVEVKGDRETNTGGMRQEHGDGKKR